MSEINEKLLHQMSRIILQNEKRSIREQDLQNLCSPEEFKAIIPQLVGTFKALGFSLIRTTFLDEKYYVLTAPGKDDGISPSMYGALALVQATLQEIGEPLASEDARNIFQDIWGEVEGLVAANYLALITMGQKKVLDITPLGKGALKNIIRDLDLQKILSLQTKSGL